MQSVNKFNIAENINLYYINDTKYKTVSMTMYLHRELSRKEITKNALLAKVLRRGTQKYNTIKDINTHLENLYGSLYSIDISKKADVQSISCTVSNITDKYGEKNLSVKNVETMLDFIFQPYLENGVFASSYVETEKKNLKDDIEAIINDKRSYANMRCIENMCKGQKNAILECGYIEDLKDIDNVILYEHYKEVIAKSPIDFFVVGDVEISEIVSKIKSYISDYKFDILPLNVTYTKRKANEVKYVEEKLDVNQGKLAMGFMTGVNADDALYYSLLVGNSIYGAGAHSKLFNNVREKMSLAYYAGSRLDKFNSLMIVSSGIEFKNYEKAKDEILVQLQCVKNGDFSQGELNVAKDYIINSYKSYLDSPYLMKDFYLASGFTKTRDTLDDAIKKVEAVKKEDVIKAFENVELDTVYFLKGNSCE